MLNMPEPGGGWRVTGDEVTLVTAGGSPLRTPNMPEPGGGWRVAGGG